MRRAFPIERGVPVPNQFSLTATFRKMVVGDSFVCSYVLADKVYGSAHQLGIRVRVRKLKSESEDRNCRVWLVEGGGSTGGTMNLYKVDGTLDEHALLGLFHSTDGWLDILNKSIPLEEQTEEMWEFIMGEGVADFDFDLIPERFRTDKILLSWMAFDLGRIRDVPKEYWTCALKFKVLRQVLKCIGYAEPLKDLQEMREAIDKLRIERNVPDGVALIRSPSPI